MKRQVVGLKWARECQARPGGIPVGRPRGVKALGVRYEKDLGKALGTRARAGVWFEFEDRNGLGWCQVDFLVPGLGLVLEAKYTWKAEAHQELSGLYIPVVEAAWGKRPVGVVVCKVLTPEVPREWVRGTLDGAWELGGGIWHWIGGPVWVGENRGIRHEVGVM